MASPSLPIVGLSTTNFLPGVYLQINWAAGQASGTQSPMIALLMGNALASSPCVANSLVDGYVWGPTIEGFQINTVNDVINEFGSGSELHRMYGQFVASNRGATECYLLAVKESTGSAAALTVTFTNTATANGSVRTYIGASFVDTPISLVNSLGSADTASNVATNVAASINSNPSLAVSAVATGAAVAITAKQKGLRGNFIRVASRVSGVGVATTSSAQMFANLSGGTTSDVWTNALATIDSRKFDYIVCPDDGYTGSGPLGELVAQVVSQSAAIPGIRQRVMAAITGSEGGAIVAAQGLNTPLCDMLWEQNSNYTPGELAAYACGSVVAGESQSVPMLNWDWLGTTPQTASQWQLIAPFDGTVQTSQTLTSVLAAGVSPVQALPNGQSSLVSLITTYCINPVSLAIDTRVRDHSIVTVIYLGANLIQSTLSESYANKLAAPDPPPGSKPPTSAIVTPSVVLASVNKVISNMYAEGLLEDLADTLAATQVVLEVSPPSRFGISVSLIPIVPAHQFAVSINQLSLS